MGTISLVIVDGLLPNSKLIIEGARPMIRPIKGVAIDDESYDRIQYPIIGFPKIDGFRCVLGDHPLTSRLSRFPNEHFHTELSKVLHDGLLDSEVVVGRKRGKGVLQRTSSGLTSKAGTPDFTLWVFDHFNPEQGFRHRYDRARQIVQDLDHPRVRLLKYKLLKDRDQLEAYLDRNLEREYEGIILRSLDGRYKEGKSTLREQYMLKIKPFEDAEGRVTGWFEEEENTNEAKREVTGKLKRSSAKAGKVPKGTLGGLILKDCRSGVKVRVGGGFTREQRIHLWPIRNKLDGLLVRYKKQRMGEKDKPRHPNFVEFVDFRPEWDYTG
jgi:DNA ligase-1